MEGRSSEESPATSKPEFPDLFSSSSTEVRLPVMAPKPGNAFSQRLERERLNRQSFENPDETVAIPMARPGMPRLPSNLSTRSSTLDLTADLALPMPRTRPRDSDHPAYRNDPPLKGQGDDPMSRSFTDPSDSHAPKHLSAMPKPLFSEKKSKMAMLKSKFSIENIGKKNKKSADRQSPVTPVTPIYPENKLPKPRSSADVSARIPSMVSEDTTRNDDVPERATPSKKPQIKDVQVPVQKSIENPDGRLCKEYENQVVEEPRAPPQGGPGSVEPSHQQPPGDDKVEGMIMGDPLLSSTRQGTQAKCHQVQVTETPRIPSIHGVIEHANPASANNTQEKPEEHSRQNSVEGESVYESVVSNRSSVDNSQIRAWEQMHTTHPSSMPSFPSAYVPTPTAEMTVAEPKPVATRTTNASSWPFIVSSTRPMAVTQPTPSGISSTTQIARVPTPMVPQSTTFQQDACMFTRPMRDAGNHFHHPSQDGFMFNGPPEFGAFADAPPPPPPNFRPIAPPTNSVLQPIHHHLDEQARNIGFQIASSRDYLLDQVMRRLNVIEDDVGALRQHVLLQNAHVEEVKSQMARVSNQVFKGAEGVKATERRLVEHISNLRGITGLLSVDTAAVQNPVDKEAQATSAGGAANTSEEGKNENANTTAAAAGANASEENTSTASEDVPTPTAAYRTPVKNKEDVQRESGSMKQRGEKNEEKDVFVDSPKKGGDVRKSTSTVLRINTSIPSEAATTTTLVSARTSENKDTTTNDSNVSNASTNAPADVQNTPRRRSCWPKGVKTPSSRGPNTGPANIELPAATTEAPSVSQAASDTFQSSVHPAFSTAQRNNNALKTPHRDQEREHHRNWFHSANRSRPGPRTNPKSPRIPSRPIPNNFRGGFRHRGSGYGPNSYNHNNRNNPPFGGRGNRRGSGGSYPHNHHHNNNNNNGPAVMGNNPYAYQQRGLRPEYTYDPTWAPNFPPYPQNYPHPIHHGPPHPHPRPYPSPLPRTPPPFQALPPPPPSPPPPPPPAHIQPFGGDGNMSAGITECQPFSEDLWYDRPYGARTAKTG